MGVIGVDVGGTFTDFVRIEGGTVRVEKLPSTPADPADAILRGLALLNASTADRIVHGSTVATNAFLERKGARVVFVTTTGFEDLLHLQRQNRQHVYDLKAVKAEPLVSRHDTVGVGERLGADGRVLRPLTDAELDRVRRQVSARRPEAVAVCLLHAYAVPDHEEAVGRVLGELPYVYLSSRVDPAHREYERASSTVIAAYVAPLVDRYLRRLERELGGRLRVMASSGGHVGVRSLLERPSAMILSGPAGGVVGAYAVARQLGISRLVTLDMGGTSTDVSLLPGRVLFTRELRLQGLPLRIPVVDVHTIGAGGGSIARLDAGGRLQVGPQSQGAAPGPACYGRGGELPTVTDAEIVLGRLPGQGLLGGRLPLDEAAARRVFEALAKDGRRRGVAATAEALAEGVLEVAETAMARALRRVTAERGVDPEGAVLLAYGGAAGLHAARLAAMLGLKEVLVPPAPGAFSAFGLASSDAVWDAWKSVLRPARPDVEPDLEAALTGLIHEGRVALREEGFPEEALLAEATLELRYAGESYELSVPWLGSLSATLERFHRLHEERFLHADPSQTVEVVNLAVQVRASAVNPPWPKHHQEGTASPEERRTAVFAGQRVEVPVYRRSHLPTARVVSGPAVILEDTATTLVPPGSSFSVDPYGILHLTPPPRSTL